MDLSCLPGRDSLKKASYVPSPGSAWLSCKTTSRMADSVNCDHTCNGCCTMWMLLFWGHFGSRIPSPDNSSGLLGCAAAYGTVWLYPPKLDTMHVM